MKHYPSYEEVKEAQRILAKRHLPHKCVVCGEGTEMVCVCEKKPILCHRCQCPECGRK